MKLTESQRRNLVMALLYDCTAINGNTWTSLAQRELIVVPPGTKKKEGTWAPYHPTSHYVLSDEGARIAREELERQRKAKGLV